MGLHQMGDIMRRARERRNETQEDVAFHSSVSQGWISQVELGHVAHPSAARIRKVATALGIDARRLFAAQFDIPFGDEPEAAISLPFPVDWNDEVSVFDAIGELLKRLQALRDAPVESPGPVETGTGQS